MLRCLCSPLGRTEATYRITTTTHPRHVSSSPYGRTHVWRHRKPNLPKPIVPTFPQLVTLSDGSTFTHYTTSPRSSIRLTRDVTNNPLWNYGTSKGGFEDEDGSSGRLGRFRRKFEEFSGDMDWMAEDSSSVNEIVAEVVGGSGKGKK